MCEKMAHVMMIRDMQQHRISYCGKMQLVPMPMNAHRGDVALPLHSTYLVFISHPNTSSTIAALQCVCIPMCKAGSDGDNGASCCNC